MHTNFLSIRKIGLNKEIKEIYLNRFLQSFSLGLIGIFVPIHLMRIGYSLNQAITYLIMIYLGMMIFVPLASKISSIIGIKHTISITFPIWILYFYLLFSLKFPDSDYLLIGMLYGLANVIYWVPLNTDFSSNVEKIRIGEEFGIMRIIPFLTNMISPLVGAFIITYMGFDNLIIVVCLLLLISLVPLFLTKDYKFKFGYDWKKMFNKKHFVFLGDFIMKGIIFGSNVLWPIYVFISFGSRGVINVGLAASFGAIGSIIFTFFVGSLCDRYDKVKLLKMGGLANFVVWTSAIIFVSPMAVLLLSFIKGLLFILIDMPMFIIACEQTDNKNNIEFMSFREIGLCTGRLIILALAFLSILSLKFPTVFLVASIASLYFTLSRIK
ncbi:MAG: MFS transporter [Candidatus Aenigmarchaeota archaeon]|nr:MFS transporter [Candidatus Aenigmarchaeota archaeon]